MFWHQLTLFIHNHPIVCILWLLCLIILLIIEVNSRFNSAKKISCSTLIDMLNYDKAVLLDVRELKLFAEGHISGAINEQPTTLNENNRLIKKVINHKLPLIIVDNDGIRANAIARSLQKEVKINEIYVLSGGMKTWELENLPQITTKTQ